MALTGTQREVLIQAGIVGLVALGFGLGVFTGRGPLARSSGLSVAEEAEVGRVAHAAAAKVLAARRVGPDTAWGEMTQGERDAYQRGLTDRYQEPIPDVVVRALPNRPGVFSVWQEVGVIVGRCEAQAALDRAYWRALAREGLVPAPSHGPK